MPSTDTIFHKIQFDLLGLPCIFAWACHQLGLTCQRGSTCLLINSNSIYKTAGSTLSHLANPGHPSQHLGCQGVKIVPKSPLKNTNVDTHSHQIK